MQTIRNDILKTLTYFDLFSYPLIKEEIFLYRATAYTEIDLECELSRLIKEQLIYQNKGFFSIVNDPDLVTRRIKGNNRAEQQLKIAAKSARLLSRFPYVKGIAVSGSLSKNFSTEKDDIDFFIITTANRLWIARSILHIFLKFAYLARKQKWFCLNYYIDETALEIPEQNIFTAIEIITLKPFYGNGIFDQFAKSNDWTRKYFPLYFSGTNNSFHPGKGFIGKVIEKIFNGALGNRLDNWLMKLTAKRWEKKVHRMEVNDRGGRISMLVEKHFAKPDPKFFQSAILEIYARNIEKVQKSSQRSASPVSTSLSK